MTTDLSGLGESIGEPAAGPHRAVLAVGLADINAPPAFDEILQPRE